jgi:NifU-like protein
MIKGKTVDEALKITNQDIADYLGGLPNAKMHCSVMGRDAFHAAVACYRNEPAPKEHLDGELVCECFGVTDEQIRNEIKANNLSTVEQVTHYTKAGGGCGLCQDKIQAIIDQVRGEMKKDQTAKHSPTKKLTNIQKIARIQEVVETEIRPMLQHDGGDLELIDLDGNKVTLAFRGLCTSCPSSALTKKGIESKLKELVDPDLYVEEADE